MNILIPLSTVVKYMILTVHVFCHSIDTESTFDVGGKLHTQILYTRFLMITLLLLIGQKQSDREKDDSVIVATIAAVCGGILLLAGIIVTVVVIICVHHKNVQGKDGTYHAAKLNGM